ncbi:MAG TPA: histidine phosphatase family protein, partial [bacterium]
DTVKRLLLVGHNPGVADLLATLTSHHAGLSVHYPPATLSLVEFDGDWKALAPSHAMLRWVVPVRLMDA